MIAVLGNSVSANKLRSFDLQYLHIGHSAALVVIDGQEVAIGRYVVGRLDPEGVAPDLAHTGNRPLARSLALDENQRLAIGCAVRRIGTCQVK